MEENKKRSKLTITLVVIGILLLVGIAVGLTYAYWSYTATQTTTNVITTDCLEIALEDESDAISLQKTHPISDSEGLSLTPYTFKITNKCNTTTSFNVNLEIMGTVNASSGSYVASTLDPSYVAVSLNGEAKSILSSNSSVDPTYSGSDYTATAAYRIGKGTLEANESKSYDLRLWMDESVTSTESMNKTFVSKVSVTAGGVEKNPICKRATELHTEICDVSSCDSDGYSIGDTITYGNSEVTSNKIETGDAFDCDVNGDGKYNAETERFYYVSDYYDTETNTFDTNYATLVYYNNVSEGLPNNTATYVYSDPSGFYGPQTIMLQLPTTSQWENIRLKNVIRNIENKSGVTNVSGYSYSGYAARFLTTQEVESGCYDGTTAVTSTGGLSNKCEFLYENTTYALSGRESEWWLETTGDYFYILYNISGNGRYMGQSEIEFKEGVRPVIEVAKTDIDY